MLVLQLLSHQNNHEIYSYIVDVLRMFGSEWLSKSIKVVGR